ncbi:MAG TPA: HAD family hydrolase, partial [Vicinamibacterales bacterium]|nr:HAD family hydrolase [Vicinamibacterales bacterium]
MTYRAIATDYDGTLAWDGKVDEPTVDALLRARTAGMRLLMVTGRELQDLFNTFGHTDLFDLVVAENGAVLFDPARKSVKTLAPAPPPALLARLSAEKVPVSVGHSIVATVEPHHVAVLQAIKDLGLEWHVIFNKGSVMVLPADVTKATGLAAALQQLKIDPNDVVGFGDAENDQAFLRSCGLSVAVANALPSVKELANVTTTGARGAGVTEMI